MSGSGGGSPIIAAYAIVKAFLRGSPSIENLEHQAELDREELREVEYAEMGLPEPRKAGEDARRGWFRRLWQRR